MKKLFVSACLAFFLATCFDIQSQTLGSNTNTSITSISQTIENLEKAIENQKKAIRRNAQNTNLNTQDQQKALAALLEFQERQNRLLQQLSAIMRLMYESNINRARLY